jgi:hypothetical protein
MTRDAAVQLAAVILLAGPAACGRTGLGDEPRDLSGDASTRDASDAAHPADAAKAADAADADAAQAAEAAAADSGVGYVDASVADSYAGADQDVPADSALEASPSPDAAGNPDTSTDAPTRDAAEPHLSCDQCSRGDQECGFLPQICTRDDAGMAVCESPGEGIWTCVAGDAGCAVWAQAVACRSDVPCCVPCAHEFVCTLGPVGAVCEQNTDCALNVCDALTHLCITDQCSDHRQDGQETDVDCGGTFCGPCQVGQGCRSNLDCLGGDYCSSSHVCE